MADPKVTEVTEVNKGAWAKDADGRLEYTIAEAKTSAFRLEDLTRQRARNLEKIAFLQAQNVLIDSHIAKCSELGVTV